MEHHTCGIFSESPGYKNIKNDDPGCQIQKCPKSNMSQLQICWGWLVFSSSKSHGTIFSPPLVVLATISPRSCPGSQWLRHGTKLETLLLQNQVKLLRRQQCDILSCHTYMCLNCLPIQIFIEQPFEA